MMVPVSKQQDFGFIPAAGLAVILAMKLKRTAHGTVNASTNFPCRPCGWRRRSWRLLVANGDADRVGGYRAGLCAEPCERTDCIQRRRVFLLPCRARPARSLSARRRARDTVAVRDLLRAEYLARSGRWHRAMERGRFRARGYPGNFSNRISLLSGLSLYVLPACEG